MRKLRIVLIVILGAVLLLSMTSGRFLIINDPQRADVIVALAGETDRRPAQGMELISLGYAPRMILNVPATAKIYGIGMLEIAQAYVQRLPQRQSMSTCPIVGLSTKTEAQDVAGCLKPLGVHDVLLVTSDYHTRRALSTFQHELPQYHLFVAAAYDPQQFGAQWWKHRQWAKVNLGEWMSLLWWEAIDRWRQ